MDFLNPPEWPRPSGYANGISAKGRMIFTAGVVGWDEHNKFRCSDLAGQFEQALRNIVRILEMGGAKPCHLVRLTWYITDRTEYLSSIKAIGAAYRAIIGDHFPPMAVIEVKGLIASASKVEIEATAVVPDTLGCVDN